MRGGSRMAVAPRSIAYQTCNGLPVVLTGVIVPSSTRMSFFLANRTRMPRAVSASISPASAALQARIAAFCERVERQDFEHFVRGSVRRGHLFEQGKENRHLPAQEALELRLIARVID